MNALSSQPLAPPHDPVDRRERRPVALRGHVIRENFSIVEMVVVDLSFEGCGIQVPDVLASGEAIRIAVPPREVIEAEVRWYVNGRAGIVFKPETDGVDLDRQRDRQGNRIALSAQVTMRRLGKASLQVRVFDASTHGCRVEFLERPDIDELVRIRFDGLQTLYARTCWIDGNSAGLEFERAIHPAVFDLLVARMLVQPQPA